MTPTPIEAALTSRLHSSIALMAPLCLTQPPLSPHLTGLPPCSTTAVPGPLGPFSYILPASSVAAIVSVCRCVPGGGSLVTLWLSPDDLPLEIVPHCLSSPVSAHRARTTTSMVTGRFTAVWGLISRVFYSTMWTLFPSFLCGRLTCTGHDCFCLSN